MILRGVSRRISTLDRFIPLPMRADVFLRRAEKHARVTGTSFEASVQSLLVEANDDELDRLTSELEKMAFGGNNAARDAAKGRALLYPGEDLLCLADSTLQTSNVGLC